jgi:hypothetical protein
MGPLRIIAGYKDGRRVKGTTSNFNPNGTKFHLSPAGADPSTAPDIIKISELKAIFFVKDFEGNSSYHERKTFGPDSTAYGPKLEVIFQDGEQIQGASANYISDALGFFLAPADPNSNNDRIFVVNDAVKEIRKLS